VDPRSFGTVRVAHPGPASKGFFAGIVSLRFARLGEREIRGEAGLPAGMSVESLRGPGFVGAEVTDEKGVTRLVFNTQGGDGAIDCGEQRFTGRHSVVCLSKENAVTRYALFEGARLAHGRRLLFKAPHKCSVSLSVSGQSATGTIRAAEAGDVKLYVPRLKSIALRGRPVNIDDAYDRETGILTLRLRRGAQSVSGELGLP